MGSVHRSAGKGDGLSSKPDLESMPANGVFIEKGVKESMKKRLISIAAALCLVVSLATTAAFATNFRDTEGHWAEDAINRWCSYGVVEGTSPDTFNPGSNMTRAEAAQVFVNLLKLTGKSDLGAYTDVSANAWYADALSACVANGILTGMGDGTMNPNGTISREQFFVMFARALGIPEETSLNQNFADRGSISSWARGAVYALINNGYVNGTSATAISPKANINRASVMSLLDQTISYYVVEDGTVAAVEDGVILVLAKNVTITGNADATIVVAAEGAKVSLTGYTGDGEVIVIADNVTLTSVPAGTKVIVNDSVTGTKVNGKAIAAGEEYTVPGAVTGGGGSTGPVDPDSDPDPDEPIELPDGSLEWPDGTIERPDGTIEKPDGTIEFPDGTIELPDGTIEKPDGTIEKPDGTIEKPDGTIEKPDGTIEFPNGVIETPDGSIEFPDGSYEMEDGNWELPDGTIVNGNGEVVEEV